MAVSSDIVAMYRRPRAVIRDKLALDPREDRLAGYVLMAGVLIFVAQAPGQAREAFLHPEVPLEARLYWSGLFFVFLMPLAMYGLAAASHVVARLLGGQGSWYGARLALFWALLASVPAWLLAGLVAGFIGQGIQLTLTGSAALGVFVLFWALGLAMAERRGVPA